MGISDYLTRTRSAMRQPRRVTHTHACFHGLMTVTPAAWNVLVSRVAMANASPSSRPAIKRAIPTSRPGSVNRRRCAPEIEGEHMSAAASVAGDQDSRDKGGKAQSRIVPGAWVTRNARVLASLLCKGSGRHGMRLSRAGCCRAKEKRGGSPRATFASRQPVDPTGRAAHPAASPENSPQPKYSLRPSASCSPSC